MTLELLIYLIDRVPDCNCFAVFGTVILIISLLGYISAKLINLSAKKSLELNKKSVKSPNESTIIEEYVTSKIISMTKKSILITVIMISLSALIPSKQALYMIAGVYIAKESGIPQKVLTIINTKLDEYIEEK